MSYLLDTNIISEFSRSQPNQNAINWFKTIPSDALYISVLTLGEIRKGVEKIQDRKRKDKLKHWLEFELCAWFEHRILTIDQLVADKWGRLLFEINKSVPAINSLIAATALHYDLSVVTRNTKDFDYPALQVINPWDFN